MKKILITGIAGLIGSNAAKYFLNKGYSVIGIDNFVGGYKENIPVDKNLVFIEADILDNSYMQNIFKILKPEIILHCAALAYEGLSVFSPFLITNNIYSGTMSIASASISCETVKLFINFSSMARYGNIKTPFYEQYKCYPEDPYGLAKLQAEQSLNLLSKIYNLNIFHLVPHNVSGHGQVFTDPYRNVLSIFINRALQDKPLYIYGDGEQTRSFSNVQDCVLAISNLINYNLEHIIPIMPGDNVFNIGPTLGSEITINKLAKLIINYLNSNSSIKHLPDRPQEVKHAFVSTEKAEDYLSYKITKTLDDTIKETVNWVKQHNNKEFNYNLPIEIVTEKTPQTWTHQLFNK